MLGRLLGTKQRSNQTCKCKSNGDERFEPWMRETMWDTVIGKG